MPGGKLKHDVTKSSMNDIMMEKMHYYYIYIFFFWILTVQSAHGCARTDYYVTQFRFSPRDIVTPKKGGNGRTFEDTRLPSEYIRAWICMKLFYDVYIYVYALYIIYIHKHYRTKVRVTFIYYVSCLLFWFCHRNNFPLLWI